LKKKKYDGKEKNKMKNKLFITRGAPASGKTTWANNYIAKHRGVVRVNLDNLRRTRHPSDNWPGYKYSKANEKDVTEHQESMIKGYALGDYDVIVDDTNLNEKTFKRLSQMAKSLGFEVEVKEFFDVPLHKLIERNLKREWSVPEDVIHRMFRKQLEIQDRVIKPTEGLPDCVICDVDGTIADMRKGHPEGRMPYEWDKVHLDAGRWNVIEVVQDLSETYPIVFLTGRDGVCYDDTHKWLRLHIDRDFQLFSREADDHRPDCEIKEELLRTKVLPHFNVKFCIDDRNQMVDHWRALGLECWQVAAGRF
jgi:predicted kinase